MANIKSQLRKVKKNQALVFAGRKEFIRGIAHGRIQEWKKDWRDEPGTDVVDFVWTDKTVLAYIPSFNLDKQHDWMSFRREEVDREPMNAVVLEAKEFARAYEPRWKHTVDLGDEKEWFIADIGTDHLEADDSEGMFEGDVYMRYVLLETKEGERMLLLTPQKADMTGTVNACMLVDGKVIDPDDVIESIE